MQLAPETFTSLFSKDREVVRAAGEYLRSYSFDCLLVSFVFCMNAYFSGCGKSIVSFLHSMAATFGVRIPATYLLSRHAAGGLFYMGFAAPAATALSLVICGVYLAWSARRQAGSPQAPVTGS